MATRVIAITDHVLHYTEPEPAAAASFDAGVPIGTCRTRDEVLTRSDFVSLHASLTPETGDVQRYRLS